MNQYQKNLAKGLRDLGSHRHQLWTVFSDFVEASAIALASIDRAQAEKREARYLQIMARYEPAEVARFPVLFGELVLAMEHEPSDVLGKTFSELELGNKNVGQFFTPYELCKLMASMTVGDGDDMREKIAERGFITASEPACGAGAQIIALAETMKAAGINYQQHLHVTAVDVDSRAVHMAYLQLSLLHVPATIVVGNTLTLEEREHWYTPAHIMGFWGARLRRGYALGSRMDATPRTATEVSRLQSFGEKIGEQLAMFDEVPA